ncbi:hypothetical protein EHQ81_04095 [Leptospira selangorensis]|uniref:DUF5683 domain-containing protein n=1 Tax=Leptospira selangorensis TaxID=2484982 RepID=A0A5F2C2E9_9LEPT|nr:hypothetical protein EHQ81_04095 [Leptospira selangorensis]TGM18728.1 hypothetical protein EHQ82_15610 [Leptospira selangorensis]
MKKIVLFCIFFFGLTSIYSQEQATVAPEMKDRSRWDLVWRSAVLPGWGLFHAKEYRKARLTMIITSVLILSELKGHKEEVERREEFENSRNLFIAYSNFYSQPDPGMITFLANYQHSKQDDLDGVRSRNDLRLALLGTKYILQLAYTYWRGIKWEEGDNSSGFDLNIRTYAQSDARDQVKDSFGMDLKYRFLF